MAFRSILVVWSRHTTLVHAAFASAECMTAYVVAPDPMQLASVSVVVCLAFFQVGGVS